jgi:hypothetical protein
MSNAQDDQDRIFRMNSIEKLLGPDGLPRMTELEALEQVREFLGSFRRGELIDPVIFGRNMAKIFTCYPRQIALVVCDPVKGMPSMQDWIPSLAQVKAACDAEIAQLHRIIRFRNWGKPANLELTKDEPVRPTMEQLKAKYGPNWGIASEDDPKRPEPFKMLSMKQLDEHYRKQSLDKTMRGGSQPSVGDVKESGGDETSEV